MSPKAGRERAVVLVGERADGGEDGDSHERHRDGEGVGEREPEICERHGPASYP
jgi:hypothetical protein